MLLPSAPFHFDLGDVPTWLAVIAAAGAAFIALRALKAQNSEIARQVAALERQQANLIYMTAEQVAAPQPGPVTADSPRQFNWGVAIANHSRRPIRDVSSRLETEHSAPLTSPVNGGFRDQLKG